MEKELIELFESAKRAADMADDSPGEVDRCVDAIKQLKKFPVNYQVLVSTQVGKRLRQLTKHKNDKIKSLASDVVEIWKGIIVKETTQTKNGSISNDKSVKAEPSAGAETNEHKKLQRTNSTVVEQKSVNKHVRVERNSYSGAPNSDTLMKSETSASLTREKVEFVQTTKNAAGEQIQVNIKVNSEMRKQTSVPVGPPKLSSLVYCKDPTRDKLREILAEALCKVSGEVDDELREKADACDPYRVAVLVETAMFEKWGKSTGPHKFKYRSIIFNIKDPHNPDFRRKVLLGDIEPHAFTELTPDDMASDARQIQNEKIKEKALFNSQRGGPPKASTNEFTCGRCKKKETTYYQLQTRSADEPMTTFVTCVNCNNRWKF
ncbi:transcription elongation factor A protein 3-like [Dorcoceras hygrometricum]|uniref:Transcription elongation factor n=1 Tax=Dorcoceras hygrometricum TaxID=472368 RepID=A0A2Z7D469_9LAMI|nr:transcription elongation factor A protein 3-like [Dorcoceras hygrometricum]